MTAMLLRMEEELTSFFLSEYSPNSPKRKLIDIVREQSLKSYSSERVESFIEKRIDSLRTLLVNEFNDRNTADRVLRFEIVDPLGEGHYLRGLKKVTTKTRLNFQDLLNQVSPNKFEALAAIILERLECESVFFTPQSHDQGVDAFGYRHIFPTLPKAVSHKLVWIAQAKHYVGHSISTNAIRELVGTSELLLSRIFSTVDEKYKELKLAPYGPAALVVITTHEFPSSVRRLAERSGVFLLEASDIFDLFKKDTKSIKNLQNFEKFIDGKSKNIPTLQ